jgi:hypothetical protein
MTEIVTTEQVHPIEVHQPPTPPQAPRERFLGAEDIFRGAGTLEVDNATMAILMGPVDESQICIRPDGIVYLPWVFYADRLRRAFGTSWALVAGDKPTLERNQVIWLHHLIVRGCYVSSSYGQCNYHANNRGMSYGDAIEGAKSDALTRCCKPLGISAELWDPAFILSWKKKWAESGGGGGYGSKWRKKRAEDVGWDQAFLNRVEELNVEHFKKNPPQPPEPEGVAITHASHAPDTPLHPSECADDLRSLKKQLKEEMGKHGIKRPQWRDALTIASEGAVCAFPDLDKLGLDNVKALLAVFALSGDQVAEKLKEPENDGS